MNEAELNSKFYLKTIKVPESLYVNTLYPKKELEILGDTCIVKSWNSVSNRQKKNFDAYLNKNAKILGKRLTELMR